MPQTGQCQCGERMPYSEEHYPAISAVVYSIFYCFKGEWKHFQMCGLNKPTTQNICQMGIKLI